MEPAKYSQHQTPFAIKRLPPKDGKMQLEVGCAGCRRTWELERDQKVEVKPTRYYLVCPDCETQGYFDL